MEILMEEFKTGYEWCVEAMLRPMDLSQWSLGGDFTKTHEEQFFEIPISKLQFMKVIGNCTVKSNSLPRKTEKYLEYRMYGLVPYNLSPIQQGIQYGHAVQEYNNFIHSTLKIDDAFWKWAFKDKTFIILNGGTTNNNPNKLGSLNKHLDFLRALGVKLAAFYEPDLGDQLTAIVFLVDERVFNKELYPDYEKTEPTWPRGKKPTKKQLEEWEAYDSKNFDAWCEKIGNEQNVVLRKFLSQFRLA